MRVFFGVTFLYAGLDKLTDPAFLNATGLGSIGSQLQGYLSVSPLAPLVRAFAAPAPVAVGAAIAIAEIGVGLGALTGLAFRLSAFGGLSLSLLFWLTASWEAHPYYYGADLPYAAGWLLILIAGDSGYTVAAWLDRYVPAVAEAPRPGEVLSRRDALRLGLQVAFLGVASSALGAAAWLVTGGPGRRPVRAQSSSVSTNPAPSQVPGASGAVAPTAVAGSPLPSSSQAASLPSTPAAATRAPVASIVPTGDQVAFLKDVKPHEAFPVTDPVTGDPAYLFLLASGTIVCYDALCTHEGCPVEFDQGSELLFCPCHGAVFDPAHGAKVLRGPTRQPLPALPLVIDAATGAISITG